VYHRRSISIQEIKITASTALASYLIGQFGRPWVGIHRRFDSPPTCLTLLKILPGVQKLQNIFHTTKMQKTYFSSISPAQILNHITLGQLCCQQSIKKKVSYHNNQKLVKLRIAFVA
jgi:hypothetical protein